MLGQRSRTFRAISSPSDIGLVGRSQQGQRSGPGTVLLVPEPGIISSPSLAERRSTSRIECFWYASFYRHVTQSTRAGGGRAKQKRLAGRETVSRHLAAVTFRCAPMERGSIGHHIVVSFHSMRRLAALDPLLCALGAKDERHRHAADCFAGCRRPTGGAGGFLRVIARCSRRWPPSSSGRRIMFWGMSRALFRSGTTHLVHPGSRCNSKRILRSGSVP